MNKNYNNIFKKLTGGKKPSYDEQNYHNGITRIKKDNEFFYFYIKDKKPASQKDLDRIKKLKIPPAWENLWVSIDAKSDIQAIGVDEKGRKQYKYNEKHIEEAEKEKF
jgi:DNA topoisomerase-1